MGLDMYLNTFPRTNELTIQQLDAISDYHTDILRGNMHLAPEGFDTWNKTQQQIAKEIVDAATTTYYDWDDNHELPRSSIGAQVGYWRKANAVHQYFVDAVQDGEDDCRYHREVTRGVLFDLQEKCKTILENAVMTAGKIVNGYTYDGEMKRVPIYEAGRYVINPEVCEENLPTTSGFFFGSTSYDQWYMDDIAYTYELVTKLLNEFDFENNMLYYVSSW